MIPSLLQIPSAVSDSKLHSVLPNNGKGDFQFDRSTGATRINRDGLIEEVGYFSSELVQNGNFSELGSELITNGDFATDSNWTKGTGWIINDGKAINTGGANFSDLTQNNTNVTIGKTYKITYTISNYTSGSIKFIMNNNSAAGVERNSNGTYTDYISALSQGYSFRTQGSGFIGKIDNVSVKQVDPNDRWNLETGWSYGDNRLNFTTGGSSNRACSSSAGITNGKTYKLSFNVLSISAGQVALRFGGMAGVDEITATSTGVHSGIITANSSANGNVQIEDNDNSFVGSITDVSVVEVQGDRPRLSYDITNGVVEDKPHLLLEPSSTNRILFSEDFTQWSQLSGTTVEYVADLVNPDGSVGGYKVSGSGIFISDGNGMSGAATSTSGRSIYARSVSGTGNVQLLSHNTNTNNVFTVNETWQRFELNSTPQISQNFYGVDFRGASSTISEIYLFAAQSESIDIVTSYIKTAGTTITRAAETCNNSKPSVNSTEGVFYCEIAALADDLTFRSISINDGTSNEAVIVRFRTTSNRINGLIRDGGSAVNNLNFDVTDIKDFHKVAYKFKTGDCALYVDGTEVATGTASFTLSTQTTLNFDNGVGDFFYGKVKGLALYNEALTDAQLITLTS